MIKVAIVDDDITIQNMLTSYIEKYKKQSELVFNIKTFDDAKQIISPYKSVYDVIFMDIEMKETDGLAAAEKIREADEKVIIIFVTNSTEHAIKGFKVNALSYIVKPISYIDFAQQLDRIVKKLEYSNNTYVLVKSNSEIIRLAISKIAYMESVKHTVIIHMENENITIYSSLKALENKLEKYHFARCNSCYLVNLAHVEKIEKDNVIICGVTLALSRPKKKAFVNALTEYIGGEC